MTEQERPRQAATKTPSINGSNEPVGRHILVTGGSGVLGSALIENLNAHNVTALVHNRPSRLAPTSVIGDITRPRMGIDKHQYRALCAGVDLVIHCAGVVDFSADPASMRLVNIDGVSRAAEFAADAGAEMIHVSTAYVARRVNTARAAGPNLIDPAGYVESKCRGEDRLREMGVTASVVRPSIIVGDSTTGHIAEYQGFHKFIHMIMTKRVPFFPAGLGAFIDVVPQDVVVDALLGLVSGDLPPGEYWITSGAKALTAKAVVELLTDEAAAEGIDLSGLRVVNPEIIDRLMRPAFFDGVPAALVKALEQLTTICSQLFTDEPLPSSLDELETRLGPQRALDPQSAWHLAIRHVLTTSVIGDRPLADAVAGS